MVYFLTNKKLSNKKFEDIKYEDCVLNYIWGPSAFALGLIEICLENNPDPEVKNKINKLMKQIENDYIIRGKKECVKFIEENSKNPYPGTEVMLYEKVDLLEDGLIGIGVKKEFEKKVIEILKKYPQYKDVKLFIV